MGPKLEDKYPPMTAEEQEQLREKLEDYEEYHAQRAGQTGGGMWDGDV